MQHKKGDRARAVIQDGDKILMIERNRAGEIYYVLPGGHIEEGEMVEETILREVKEETSVEVKLGEKLGAITDKDGTTHYIYFCQYISGEPCIAEGSPEAAREGALDIFTPMWVNTTDIKDLPMWPAEVKPFLIQYLEA